MSDPSCVFCKIIAGEIPSLRVFEDEHAFAFLDIGPLSEGHTLLIPKAHVVQLDQMSPDAVSQVTRCLPMLGAAVVKAASAAGYNVLQNNGEVAGQVVPHVHFHIIPRHGGDGLGYRWNASRYADQRGKEIQRAIVGVLSS